MSNVFGFFTVPDLTLREGVGAPQFAAAWVGVDGAECNGTLLQAGVTTIVSFDLFASLSWRGLAWLMFFTRTLEEWSLVGWASLGLYFGLQFFSLDFC